MRSLSRLSILMVLIGLAAAGSVALGLGSLTREGSVWKKTAYSCVCRALLEDDAGRLYLGTFGAGLWIRTGETWAQIRQTPGGLPDERLSKLLVEGEDLLVATAGGGAARLHRPSGRWSPLTPFGEPPSRHFHALAILPDGGYLLGSVGDGLCLATGGRWITLKEPDGLPSDWINDALPEASGTWLATYAGLAYLEGTRVTRVEHPEQGWRDGNINVLARFQGNLFLGTGSGGLVERLEPLPGSTPAGSPQRSPRRRVTYRRIPGIPDQVHALLPVGDTLWIGTEEGLFRLLSDRAVERREGPASASRAIKSLGLTRAGVVAGTDVGQVYLVDGKNWVCLFDHSTIHTGGNPR
ncbi:MAG: GGDEF family protein [Candidatus Ozemobacter sibiricus]|uniref:GGDEF family protein n=1 Tax=Candidatus Ozemobacter sibiricus TaxID=2268124 RepID=A0A367ZS76_9BACT|nr:MAG: GGDEF family protein [Candidatus Ozemobacter sibiricus]